MSLSDFKDWLRNPEAQKRPVKYPPTSAQDSTPIDKIAEAMLTANEPPQGLSAEELAEWHEKNKPKDEGKLKDEGKPESDGQVSIEVVSPLSGENWSDKNFSARVLKTAQALLLTVPEKHYGYGDLFYNPTTREAIGVSADSHTAEEVNVWLAGMKECPGVSDARITDESYPTDDGFYRIVYSPAMGRRKQAAIKVIGYRPYRSEPLSDAEIFEDALATDSWGEYEMEILADDASGLVVRQKAARVDYRNKNNRLYPRPVFEKAILDAQDRVRQGIVLSDYQHPPVVSTGSGDAYADMPDMRTARIDDIEMPDEKGWVYIRRTILDTPKGREVAERIRSRRPYGLSSRMKLSGKRNESGVLIADSIKLITFDDVFNPAVPDAGSIAE